ncbi:MAG TPA: T9SS type A sorting domain-containing protein [Moheibacter sp.]|nr:T9SS type A sorting domain-containing protein [Moheibacter sp.]
MNAQMPEELIGWDMTGQGMSSGQGEAAWGNENLMPTTLSDKLEATGLIRLPKYSVNVANNNSVFNAWGGAYTTSTLPLNPDEEGGFTFTVTPKSGNKLALSSLDLFYRRASYGSAQGLFQYKINDGAFTDIVTLDFLPTAGGGFVLPQVDLSSVAELQEVTSDETITFRMLLFGKDPNGVGSSVNFFILNNPDVNAISDFYLSGIVDDDEIGLPNDNCEDVTPVELTNGIPHTFTGTTLGATASAEETAVLGMGAVWHAVTLTGDCNNLTVDYCGTPAGNMAVYMRAYTQNCPITEFVNGSDDVGYCDDGNSQVRFSNLPAGTYYLPVAVIAFNTLGDYTMNVLVEECAAVPENDNCEDAIAVSCGETYEGSTLSSTDSGGNESGDVFYTFTGNGTEQLVSLSLCNSDYDTVIRVFTNCTLTEEVAFNDDSNECGEFSNHSFVTFTSDGTTQYVIMVEGYGEHTGNFELEVSCEDIDDDFPAPYCEIDGYSNLETISRVLVTDSDGNVIIDNSSIASNEAGSAPFHENFTNIIGDLTAGETYQIAVEGYTGGDYRNSITVFIDWNQDEAFDNVTERYELGVLENSTGTDGQQATSEIEVPMYAVSGNTRMRVMKRYESFDPPLYVTDACTVGDSFGQAEDYTLNLSGGDEEPQDGCLEVGDPTFPQYPTTTIIPQCYGTPQILTNGVAYTGEYSIIQVTAGTEYVFSSSIDTYLVTIGDEEGNEVLAYGTGSVTWTADADRLVRFYTHLDAYCNAGTDLHDRIIQCGEVPPPPANDNCEDITPTVLTNGVSVTFNGTTVGGTSSDEEIALLDYGAVWEAVTLTGDCNNLAVDYCGTIPENMYSSFVVYTLGCDATEYVPGVFDFITCEDGNTTVRFANLPAGTYYLPVILDWAFNTPGEYVMNVISEDCALAPVDCEDYEIPSNNLENGWFFAGAGNQRLATDIPVADQPLTVYGMEPTVIGEATSFDFIIYSDNAGLPGTQLETRTGTILGDVITGTNFDLDFHKYTVAFDVPLELDANTTYWIEVVSNAQGWESTSNPFERIGNSDVDSNIDTGGAWESTEGEEFVFNLICEELGINDLNSFDFTYYPNPVKDVLNISSKKEIESVSVFNLAGQKVLNNAEVSNNQVDINSLTPGTYVFKVTLEGRQTETFKIIKK